MRQLKLGSKGSDVITLQNKLGLTNDGHFGPLTEKAVEKFQLDKSLMITGVVDADMWVLILNIEYNAENAIDEDSDTSSQYFKTNFNQLIHKHYLPKEEYIDGPIQNEYIVLHHTAGNANPYMCIDQWGKDTRGKIATEFVLGGVNHHNGNDEFDGIMVQAFPKGCQGWHLGKTASGFMNRHSVGLEICSMGYLDNIDKTTYVGSKCIADQIRELPQHFKGKLFWHKYSESQIKETEKWIKYVGERDKIDIRLGLKQFIKKYGATKGFDFQENAFYGKVKGLLTHTNVRKDKMDCYPDPDFVDMIISL